MAALNWAFCAKTKYNKFDVNMSTNFIVLQVYFKVSF